MNPQPENYDDALENLRNAPVGSVLALYTLGAPYAQPRAAVKNYGGQWEVTGTEHRFSSRSLLKAWTYEALR